MLVAAVVCLSLLAGVLVLFAVLLAVAGSLLFRSSVVGWWCGGHMGVRVLTCIVDALRHLDLDVTTTTTNKRSSTAPCRHRAHGGSLIRCGDPLTPITTRISRFNSIQQNVFWHLLFVSLTSTIESKKN